MTVSIYSRINIYLPRIIFLYIVYAGCSTSIHAQQLIRVPEDYSTIQTAIYQSDNYDTIIIGEGTYFENLLLRDKTLIIGSEYLLTGDTSFISNTIIDGQNSSAVLRIDGNVGEETTISGLTFQNGTDGILPFVRFNLIKNHILNCGDAIDYENNSGGLCSGNVIELNGDDAIDLDSTVNIVIENNIIRNNGDDGIEIRLHRYTGPTAEIAIKKNQIYNNGEDGIQIIGDIETTDRILYIDNNVIYRNDMAGIGSMANMNTVENYEGSNVEERIILTNNTITENNHGITGSDNMFLINNIVASNEVAGIKNIKGNSVIVYSDIWQNGTDVLDCNIDSITTFFLDPLLDSEFHLMFNSPCIDAGISYYLLGNDTIFKSSRIVLGNAIDIGASEYDPGYLLKGPYLTYQNIESQMVITWQLKSTSICILKWGRTEDYYTNRSISIENSSDSLEHIHSYVIKGLVPGSKYYYLMEENGVKHYGSFLSPPASDSGTVSFYSFGDSRSAMQMLDSISAAILQVISLDTLSQTFILHAGDWTTTGSEDDWQEEFFNRWYFNTLNLQSMVPFSGVRGSHENFFDPNASVYRKYFDFNYSSPETGLYYSFDYGPVHISVVDQYISYDTTSAQYSWLVNDLSSTDKKWKIIAIHEPGYSDGGHLDNLEVQLIIQPLCTQYDVHLVIAGHNHYYAHHKIDNTHHLTLGGGGAPLYDPSGSSEGLVFSEKTFHFAKIEAKNKELTVTIIKPDGSVVETFTIAPALASPSPVENEVIIYPNPCKDLITIDGLNQYPKEKYTLEIRSLSGVVLIRREVYENRTDVNMNDLPPGLYFCVLKTRMSSNTYRIVKI